MFLNPVAIFAYNRPDLLARTLESLAQCNNASDTSVYLIVDGPKSPAEKEKVEGVIRLQDKFKDSFASLEVRAQEKNRGLVRSVREGLDDLFQEHEALIVLEDDFMLARDFLDLLNLQLELYANVKSIGSLSGNIPIIRGDGSRYENFFHPRPTSWGWATWRDRWENAIWDAGLDSLANRASVRYRINKGGSDLYRSLIAQARGEINSWAVLWAYTHMIKGWVVSYPYESRVINIGFGEDATHCKVSNPYKTQLVSERPLYEFRKDVKLEPKLVRQLNYYNSNYYKVLYKLGAV